MDTWDAAQNWLVFGAVAGGLLWYYYPQSSSPIRVPIRPRELEREIVSSSSSTNKKQRSDNTPRQRTKNPSASSNHTNGAEKIQDSVNNVITGDVKAKNKSKKATASTPSPAKESAHNDEDDEIDMSTRQFAQQLSQARKGHVIAAPKGSERRTRTVKQANAIDERFDSSNSSYVAVDANEDASVDHTAPLKSGQDVSDMLEPKPAAPTTLRLTDTEETKRKPSQKAKVDVVETKKQRQNRQKVEERKLAREEDERQRKALEERQRRTAREARGEPAKNGLASAPPPAQSAWDATQSTSARSGGVAAGPALLDTFEPDSTPSKSASIKSSRADSTDEPSMAQSVDESGWTTVSVPKKQQKKNKDHADDESVSADGGWTDRVAAPAKKVNVNNTAPKGVVNGKPNGFQALNDHYEQRSNIDPSNAENWDA